MEGSIGIIALLSSCSKISGQEDGGDSLDDDGVVGGGKYPDDGLYGCGEILSKPCLNALK